MGGAVFVFVVDSIYDIVDSGIYLQCEGARFD